MNVKGHQIEPFLAAPPTDVRGVLLYGPDAGMIDERGRGLLKLLGGAVEDPFRTVELARRDVEQDPARLADELAALSFTGGRRVVRLREAADGLATTVETALSAGGEAFLVVEAGELPGRSALRKLFEGAGDLAAIGCYRDDERSLPAVVRNGLSEHGLRIADDALAYLVRHLGGDRQVTRRELEKLALYMAGGDSAPDTAGSTVSLEDVQASVGDSAEITQEDLVYAVAGGDPAAAERAFARAVSEGIAEVSLVRAVVRHFQRLHQVVGAAAAGQPLDSAIGRLRPAVFWKRKKAFEAQAARWSPARLRVALDELTALEVDLKSGGLPQDLLASRALLRLAVNAPRRRA